MKVEEEICVDWLIKCTQVDWTERTLSMGIRTPDDQEEVSHSIQF